MATSQHPSQPPRVTAPAPTDPASGIVVIERGGMADLALGAQPRWATQTPIMDIGPALDYLRGRFAERNPRTLPYGTQLWIREQDSLTRDARAMERATRAGWDIRGTAGISDPLTDHWLLAFHVAGYMPGGFSLVFPALDRRGAWAQARDAAELSSGLRAYARALGRPYYRSPQATAAALLRDLHSGAHATRLETPAQMPPLANESGGRLLQDAPLMWRNATTRDALAARPYLLSFDVNAQHLRATDGLAVGFGEPLHLEGPNVQTMLDGFWTQGKSKLPPGYWRVRLDPRSASRRLPFPHPLYRRNYAERPFTDRGAWVTTPTLRLLMELNMGTPRCDECWMWPQSHRIFDPWYKRLRDARALLMDDATPAGRLAYATMKETANMLVGGLAMRKRSASDPLKRPDWRHLVIAAARALHYLMGVVEPIERGYLPVLITEDTVAYLVETDDPQAAATALGIRLGTAPGQYKIKDNICVSEWSEVETALLDTRMGVHEMQTLLASVRRQQGRAEDGLGDETDGELE